jgi:glycosyltransferase involved in cell wall biosynthesis
MLADDEWGVSVVIPVYNGARYLNEALQSILAQTEAPREVILVDDGSTDDSAILIQQVAASAPIPMRYTQQANHGTAAARNRGIELAAGPLIAFLDQDDLWLPQKLARQVALLRQQPEAGYSITHMEFFIEPGLIQPAWIRPERLQGAQVGYLPSCLLARRETFERVGMFDPSLPNGSDTDWFGRVREAQIQIAIDPAVLVRNRIHDGNQSRFVQGNRQDLYGVVRNALRRKRLPGVADVGVGQK